MHLSLSLCLQGLQAPFPPPPKKKKKEKKKGTGEERKKRRKKGGVEKREEVLNEKFDFFGKLLLLAPNYPACVKPAGRSSGFERRKLFTLYLMAQGGPL